jgi:uncharacterized protein
VQAFLGSSGPAYACLELAEEGVVSLLISKFVLAEVADVLSQPALRKHRQTITTEAIEEFLDRIVLCSGLVDDVPRVFTYPRDPEDEPYLDLALAGNARYIVTRDRDLLDLMKDDQTDGQQLGALLPNLDIIDPSAFLRALAS